MGTGAPMGTPPIILIGYLHFRGVPEDRKAQIDTSFPSNMSRRTSNLYGCFGATPQSPAFDADNA